MSNVHLVDQIVIDFRYEELLGLLREAGIQEKPDRSPGGYGPEFPNWVVSHRKKLTPFILRRRNFSNDEIAQMIDEGDLSPYSSSFPKGKVQISIFAWSQSNQAGKLSGVSLTDLAAASAMMSEMFIVLGGVNTVIESHEFDTPPVVQVHSGSIDFAVDGGLFASGIGLIVGCCAGLVAAPLVGTIAGATLASVGLLDLVINWKQKIAEIGKTDEETRVLRLEHDSIDVQQSRRLKELEIQAKEIELETARTRLREASNQRQVIASGTLPRALVIAEAKRWGFTEEYANHVLNRGVPTYSALRKYFKEIQVDKDERAGTTDAPSFW